VAGGGPKQHASVCHAPCNRPRLCSRRGAVYKAFERLSDSFTLPRCFSSTHTLSHTTERHKENCRNNCYCLKGFALAGTEAAKKRKQQQQAVVDVDAATATAIAEVVDDEDGGGCGGSGSSSGGGSGSGSSDTRDDYDPSDMVKPRPDLPCGLVNEGATWSVSLSAPPPSPSPPLSLPVLLLLLSLSYSTPPLSSSPHTHVRSCSSPLMRGGGHAGAVT